MTLTAETGDFEEDVIVHMQERRDGVKEVFSAKVAGGRKKHFTEMISKLRVRRTSSQLLSKYYET